jgi:hypothetical protein
VEGEVEGSVKEFFEGISDKDWIIGWSIMLGPFAAMILYVSIVAEPFQLPLGAVLGCYVAPGAPALEVSADQIKIHETEGRSFRYVADRSKLEFVLTVKPALGLTPTGDGRYVFIQKRGIGYFWPLLPNESDNPQNLRDFKNYRGRFEIIADDSKSIIYERVTEPNPCTEQRTSIP